MEGKLVYIGSKHRYTEEEKRSVVEYFLAHSYTKQYVWQKFTGQSSEHGQILRWLRELGYDKSEPGRFVYFNRVKSSKDNSKESLSDQEQIALLKKELEETRLKAKAFELMIELAEDEFKIRIKKKFGTKSSKK